MSHPLRPPLPTLLTTLVASLVTPLVLALAGWATPAAAPAASPQAVSVQSRPATAPATTVCTGVPSCRRVATVDVDGDGRPDQVGVVARHISASGSITVRVRTATGRTLTTTGTKVFWFAKPFFGVAALDGRRGTEIVVGDTMGANYEQFRVLTYRHNHLVTLAEPPVAWTHQGIAAAQPRWGVDGSYSFNIGVFRSVSKRHVVTLTLKTFERRTSGHGHRGHITVYRWHRGAWAEVSSRRVVLSNRRAFAAGGWHVKGLRRFA